MLCVVVRSDKRVRGWVGMWLRFGTRRAVGVTVLQVFIGDYLFLLFWVSVMLGWVIPVGGNETLLSLCKAKLLTDVILMH
jgi:hypothetical protein